MPFLCFCSQFVMSNTTDLHDQSSCVIVIDIWWHCGHTCWSVIHCFVCTHHFASEINKQIFQMYSFPNRGSSTIPRSTRSLLNHYQQPNQVDLPIYDNSNVFHSTAKHEFDPNGESIIQATLLPQNGSNWVRDETHFDGRPFRGNSAYQACLGPGSPNTSLSSHTDLLRTDSGNSSLSNTDSLSNTSTESHGSSFHSTSLDHNFSEDFSIFQDEDDLIRVNIYVPETQCEVSIIDKQKYLGNVNGWFTNLICIVWHCLSSATVHLASENNSHRTQSRPPSW